MNNKVRTPLEKLNLMDGFLFAETMDEPEAYEAVVGILLEDEIELLDRTQTEKDLRVSPELRAVRLDVFMEYINDTRGAVAARSKSPRVKLVHDRVEKIRCSEKCGVKYMQRWEEIAYARQDGYEEGRSEGRSEGRNEGLDEGLKKGRSEGALREIIAAVCRKLAKGKSEEQIADELEQEQNRISRICHIAEKYAPAYDQEAIYLEIAEL